MVTQSFAFREPISELGQAGVFTGPNMNLPWKQGAFVLQSDGRLMGPGTPEKPQIKRRRNSPVSMQQDGREFRGTYNTTTPLTPGRLANGSLQSTSEPQDLSADDTINFGDFDPESLEVENGTIHSTVTPPMDFNAVTGDSNGSSMAHSFNYPDSTGNMNLPTTPHLGAAPAAGSSESAMTAQALTDLEALLAPAGAAGSHHHAYSGPEGHHHHHNNNIQASPAPNVTTPASYMLGAANSFSPSLFTGPNFGSAGTNYHHRHNNNHHHHSYLNPPRFPNTPFLTPNSMENSQIGSTLRPATVASDMSIWGHQLSSQASSVEQQQGDYHHHHASRHALIHSSAQPRNSGDSLIMHQTHAYNIHVNAVAATPEKNRDGRRLSYVAAAPAEQKSPSSHMAALHAFEATPPPQAPNSSTQTGSLGTLHSHVYNISSMSTHQQVEPTTTTTQMPAAIVGSVVDSTVQEDPSLQEMFTQTYDPPMMTTVEMDSAQKEGYQFDLNEVPVGAMESTPNKRKKYHPRVAKDKRTYKPRKKLDNAAAPATPDGISVGNYALGSNASTPAGSKRNHTTFMTNGECFKDGMHSDVDVNMEPTARQHHLGTGNLMSATPMSPDGTPNAVYNNDIIRYITEHTPKMDHLNTANLDTSFNNTAPHDTAICDCEACIRIRLEKPGSLRRISGKGSRTSQYINPTNAPQSPFSSPSHVQAWSENMFASGLDHRQQGPTSAALNNNITETGTTELPFINTPNSRSRRRNLFNQTIFTTASPEGHATAENYASAGAAAADSSPQNAANFLQPNHVQQELEQPISSHPHHSYPRPVRRSLMGQFTLPPPPPPPQATPEESRPLSSNFCANSNFESEEGTTQSPKSRLENYSNSHSQAMVAHHEQQQQEQQDPYTVALSYFDQVHQDTTQGSSCLQQFNQAATERGFISRVDSYNDGTEELTRMGDMVVRRREPPSIHQQLQSTIFHQAHHNPFSTTSALSALSYHHHHHHHGEQFQGAIVPASGRLNWNPDLIPYTLHPRRMISSSSSSFMSRLCPRGILSPQRTPFRMMTKIQRIVYLKTILMSHHLDTSPTQLLHHVQEHLPSHEKDAFELLWPLILEPVSRQELQRLVEIAEADTTATITTNSTSSGLELTEYVHPVEKRKQRGRKPGSKNKQNNMGKAMTLWPDLIEQGHHPQPGKQKGDKGGDRQERQNSNGRDTQGLELVPYEGKAVVPYDGPFLPPRKRKPKPKVVLDTETVRVWKLLMGKPGPMDSSTEADANKELKWEEERRLMKTQADIFIKRMHLVQGDRSFSRWKGSVVDSVVGAFLTQNVNDVLSSSAFMCMRSRFPGRGFKGPLQSKAPEEALGQPLETEVRNSSPAPLAERMGEPQSSSGHQEESSSGVATSHIVSVESRPPSLESEESHNEERLYPAHLGVRHEVTMSWPDQEGEQRQLGALELQQLLQQQLSIPTELSQTAENTNSLNASDSNSAGTFPVTNSSTEQTTAEESTGANIIDTQLDLLSLAQQGTNEVRDLAMENDVGSELVTSNLNNNNPQLQQPQQQVPKGPKVFNSKSGLTGPERARQEEKQVTARKTFDWEHRREEFKPRGPGEEPNAVPPRTELTEDGVDWEAVRHADVEEVANVIKERGLNWILAGRIKAFLERLQVEHGALDLEWLRSIPTDDTKEYLLSIRGLGLKSVECIRLLTLHHLAFPVDTNVGRICVRLGWVPLEPLPEELQLHLLELYPVQATIQKYLWPRLCTLDQQTLYELHYQMITFGKVFCTKSKPNCNACPMKADCKHFASALSSAKLALPASERSNNGPTLALTPGTASSNGDTGESQGQGQGPPQIGEEDRPRSMPVSQYCQPIVEEPMTPESSEADAEDCDIEDYPFSVEEVEEDSNINLYIEEKSTGQIEQQVEIPNCCSTSDLSVTISESEPVQEMIMEDWGGLAMPSQTSHSQLNSEQDSSPNTAIKIVESGVDPESPSVTQSTAVLIPDAPSQELVLVNPENAHIPVPKLKNIGRLRTVHYVYELPDNHPLVEGMDAREADDPCTYLLAIWSPGEVPESIPNINDRDNSEENPYASTSFEGEAENIKATLLVPCRTAMQGSFPLNGTYFQVNEVFADHASSLQPILVPRTLLWNLRRRFVFFGTSVTSIFRGMTVEEIQACFWRGYVCVRGFDRTTRAPKPLVGRLHLQASKTSGKGAPMEN